MGCGMARLLVRGLELKWTSLRIVDSDWMMLLKWPLDCFSVQQQWLWDISCWGKSKSMCGFTDEEQIALEERIFGIVCRKWVMDQAQKKCTGEVTTQDSLLLTLYFWGELANLWLLWTTWVHIPSPSWVEQGRPFDQIMKGNWANAPNSNGSWSFKCQSWYTERLRGEDKSHRSKSERKRTCRLRKGRCRYSERTRERENGERKHTEVPGLTHFHFLCRVMKNSYFHYMKWVVLTC